MRVDWIRPVGCGKPEAHRIVRETDYSIDAARCAHHILQDLNYADPRSGFGLNELLGPLPRKPRQTVFTSDSHQILKATIISAPR